MTVWTMPSRPDSETEARYFMRHVVPIYFDFRKDGESKQFVQTSFAFSVYGRWLLMTAGHCITDIGQIRALGWRLEKCRLLDCLALNARYEEPVPFDYDGAQPRMLCNNPTWDYGIMFPAENTCRLLSANGVVPFDEKWWVEEPQTADAYFLFGVPEESVTASPNHVSLGPVMARLERLDEPPEGFCQTDAPMFYGALIEYPLSRLRGCSGGPILSFAEIPEGQGRAHYWVHAMQVSALRGKYVSGVRMQPLGHFLKGFFEGKHPV